MSRFSHGARSRADSQQGSDGSYPPASMGPPTPVLQTNMASPQQEAWGPPGTVRHEAQAAVATLTALDIL